jgi:hypothetical protein
MKKPPSQRPERQGPRHLYAVGQPYHPDRKMWPQTPQFNYRGGECELVLFFDQPTPAEVRAVKEGRSEFALYDRDGLVVLCNRSKPIVRKFDLPGFWLQFDLPGFWLRSTYWSGNAL